MSVELETTISLNFSLTDQAGSVKSGKPYDDIDPDDCGDSGATPFRISLQTYCSQHHEHAVLTTATGLYAAFVGWSSWYSGISKEMWNPDFLAWLTKVINQSLQPRQDSR
jgi:hypothetical protein